MLTLKKKNHNFFLKLVINALARPLYKHAGPQTGNVNSLRNISLKYKLISCQGLISADKS